MKPPKFTYADVDHSATVQGTEPYRVGISAKRIGDADCTCYMGKNG